MSYKTFKVSPIGVSNSAVRLTISNPPINLVTYQFLSEINDFLKSISIVGNQPSVVVIASADPEFWISHLDLHIISAKYPLPQGQDSRIALETLGQVLQLFNMLPTIFIAEINGRAIGGGNELAMNMDMRFAGPNARFGIPEVAGGVIHGGALQRIVRTVGAAQALEWNLTARILDSKNAARIGWVNSTYDSQEALREHVDALAQRIAGFPRAGIEATKASINEALSGNGSVEKDMKILGDLAHTEEAQKAISKLIQASQDQARGHFELGLPETITDQWTVDD